MTSSKLWFARITCITAMFGCGPADDVETREGPADLDSPISGSTAGPLAPATAVNASGIGTVAWSSPTKASASDNAWAIAALANTTSNHLTLTGFGFGIPSGATITGVTVTVERSQSGSGADIRDESVRLVKASTPTGANRAKTSTTWPAGADAVAAYGGDLWGTSLTVADVNASGFGVAIAAKNYNAKPNFARVDRVAMTIAYGGGGGATWTAESYSRTVFQDPAGAPYTAWTGAWKNPADASLWMAFAQSSGSQGAGTPGWVEARFPSTTAAPYVVPAARDHWNLTNVTRYFRSDNHGDSWNEAKPASGVVDEMRTPNAQVSSCTNAASTGSNCPAVHPIAFTPQANVALPNGTLIRRVNGDDIPYDQNVLKTAFLQRLVPGPGAKWSSPEYPLHPASCNCTIQLSRIRRLANGKLIALGQRWADYPRDIKKAAYDGDSTSAAHHLLLVSTNAAGTNWTEALGGTGLDELASHGWVNEWDAVELPNGDLLAIFRTNENSPRKQGLLRKTGATSWELDIADIADGPFGHSGHPELLASQSGAVLYLATNSAGVPYGGQKGIFYLPNEAAQQNSVGWAKLPFTSGGGDCAPAGNGQFHCSTRHYPRAIEDCSGGVCAVHVFSHAGADDDWTEVLPGGGVNEQIVYQTFQVAKR